MELVRPMRKYDQGWKEALREFEEENVGGFWNFPEKPTDIDSYILRDEESSHGTNLQTNWVPSTTYWLIDNETFIGHVNLRHRLNDKLMMHGGHIGYAIRPTERRKGYGAKILELVLPKAEELGIQKALVTCEESNIGSRKIIENNGGKYQNTVESDGKSIRRYWINLS